MLGKVPSEIFLRIIDFLYFQNPVLIHPLTTVSHRVRANTLSRRFRRLSVREDDLEWKFPDLMQHYRHLAPHVKELELSVPSTQDLKTAMHLFLALPSLTDLWLWIDHKHDTDYELLWPLFFRKDLVYLQMQAPSLPPPPYGNALTLQTLIYHLTEDLEDEVNMFRFICEGRSQDTLRTLIVTGSIFSLLGLFSPLTRFPFLRILHLHELQIPDGEFARLTYQMPSLEIVRIVASPMEIPSVLDTKDLPDGAEKPDYGTCIDPDGIAYLPNVWRFEFSASDRSLRDLIWTRLPNLTDLHLCVMNRPEERVSRRWLRHLFDVIDATRVLPEFPPDGLPYSEIPEIASPSWTPDNDMDGQPVFPKLIMGPCMTQLKRLSLMMDWRKGDVALVTEDDLLTIARLFPYLIQLSFTACAVTSDLLLVSTPDGHFFQCWDCSLDAVVAAIGRLKMLQFLAWDFPGPMSEDDAYPEGDIPRLARDSGGMIVEIDDPISPADQSNIAELPEASRALSGSETDPSQSFSNFSFDAEDNQDTPFTSFETDSAVDVQSSKVDFYPHSDGYAESTPPGAATVLGGSPSMTERNAYTAFDFAVTTADKEDACFDRNPATSEWNGGDLEDLDLLSPPQEGQKGHITVHTPHMLGGVDFGDAYGLEDDDGMDLLSAPTTGYFAGDEAYETDDYYTTAADEFGSRLRVDAGTPELDDDDLDLLSRPAQGYFVGDGPSTSSAGYMAETEHHFDDDNDASPPPPPLQGGPPTHRIVSWDEFENSLSDAGDGSSTSSFDLSDCGLTGYPGAISSAGRALLPDEQPPWIDPLTAFPRASRPWARRNEAAYRTATARLAHACPDLQVVCWGLGCHGWLSGMWLWAVDDLTDPVALRLLAQHAADGEAPRGRGRGYSAPSAVYLREEGVVPDKGASARTEAVEAEAGARGRHPGFTRLPEEVNVRHGQYSRTETIFINDEPVEWTNWRNSRHRGVASLHSRTWESWS